MLTLPARVTVVEVGPRDGLQSLGRWIDTEIKIAMIDRLSDAGFPVIEATSFASPSFVPMLTDAEEVVARIKRRPGTVYRALVPNKRGALRAIETDIDEVLGLMTVSETYLVKNQNMTLDQVIKAGGDCFRVADEAGRDFIMALGMSLYCPYEGIIAPERTLDCVTKLRDYGVRRFYLAASTGMEEPRQVNTLFRMAHERFSDCEFGFHVHEKRGWAAANLMAALDAGVTMIEGSICGIGGGIAFPESYGTVGNLPTEDIVSFLESMGIGCDLNVAAAVAAARDIAEMTGIPLLGRASAIMAGEGGPVSQPNSPVGSKEV